MKRLLLFLPASAWVLLSALGFASVVAWFGITPPPLSNSHSLVYAQLHYTAGNAMIQLRRLDDAKAHYLKAVEITPFPQAENNLANILFQTGDTKTAVKHYRQAIALQPDYADPYNNLANALIQMGRFPEAVDCLKAALEINPEHKTALSNLAWIYAAADDPKLRDPQKAAELAQQSLTLSQGTSAMALRSLAASLAAMGKYLDASALAEQAREYAEQAGDFGMIEQLQIQAATYRAGEALHLPTVPPPPDEN